MVWVAWHSLMDMERRQKRHIVFKQYEKLQILAVRVSILLKATEKNNYAGYNEELVGEALEPIRKEVVIATKLHIEENEISNGNTLYDAMSL